MVLQSPGETVGLIHKIVSNLRKRRTVSAPPVTPLAPHLRAFQEATQAFTDFIQSAPAVEEETAMFAERLADLEQPIAPAPTVVPPAGLIRLLVTQPPPELRSEVHTSDVSSLMPD